MWQEPAINRISLAERVCDLLGWTEGRGQPSLGSAGRLPADWAEAEFGGLLVWDARLKQRL